MESQGISPKPGMGATEYVGSDRYPFKITRVSESGKTFWMKRMDFKPGKDHNFFGAQNWIIKDFSEDNRIVEIAVRMTKTGWRRTGGNAVSVGHADAYQDPYF